MSLPLADNPRTAPDQRLRLVHSNPEHRYRTPWIIAVCMLAAVAVALVFFTVKWPFTRAAFIRSLEQDSQSRVTIASFQETYFPHPGCIAEGVTFQRDASSPRLTVRKLTVVGSYLGLLHRYIPQVIAEGTLLDIPAGGLKKLFANPLPDQHPTRTRVGEIQADDAQITVSLSEEAPLTFRFQRLRLNDVSRDSAVRFQANLKLPEPQGDLQVQGFTGPFRRAAAGDTPLSGTYSLRNASLQQFAGVGGMLASDGKFSGRVSSIDVTGDTDIPDFQLDVGIHPAHLTNKFHAVVNGTNGDLRLDPVESHFGKTTLFTRASLEGPSGDKARKTLALDMVSPSGTVQDLMLLFVHDAQSPMVGAIRFRAHVQIPPANAPFVRKVRLDGDFGIANASYTSPETQKQVNLASARARGQADKIEDAQDHDNRNGTHTADDDLERVVSDLQGHVVLRNGVATFSELRFHVPGAGARVHGTYNLTTRAINLRGVVHMETQISHATTGPKSFLLKIIQPLTKHNHRESPNGTHGSVVSVHMTGTYGHPSLVVAPMKGGG